MSCPWGFDCRTLFVGYQNHRNGLFSAVKIRLGSGEFFFLKSELFRCEKVQKGLIQPGRRLRNVFGLQLFRAVVGTHRIPKLCYIGNLGEKWIFAGHFNVTFCLTFTIFLEKSYFFQMQIFFYQNWWKVRRTMTAMGKKSPCMGRTHNGIFQAKNRQNLA